MPKTTLRQEQCSFRAASLTQDSCHRTEVVRMRLTPIEKEDLAKRTAQSGEKSLSDYLRKRAFEFSPRPVMPEINQEVARELRRMSAHLHSLALFAQKALAAGQMPQQNYEILREFGRQLAEYHLELKGKVFQQRIEQQDGCSRKDLGQSCD
ncbi:hypothetical protein H6G81_04540 [Scytonema hofmannii FACHB-248]|uniref:Uncharacterized protein n=1 Tax=Scytonema hofmannii FACHB-248 TaxID=1842502 RepID=A0ABR8GKY3_9CYAN|nr:MULTISPECIES: hypothetical protein [Nostocales]MBD2603818.1 hypothetical protein [Scytonema hofmannii FACHB-248]